jgi:hypothetical protein
MILRCAPAGDVALFMRAMPLLQRALTDAPMCEVYEAYKAGTAQLWLAFDGENLRAACVTQSGEDLHFWLCGGDGCDWRALGDGIAEAARGRFKRMTIDGRPGWRRLLGFTRGDDGAWERRL